ncbi:hypothetical protein J2741_002275 [Methanolinea mesophila]|nr:hypothetical protein [Methanolinea mesophila]
MGVCSDCAMYRPGKGDQGECRINGPVPPDREAERCPSRSFVSRS